MFKFSIFKADNAIIRKEKFVSGSSGNHFFLTCDSKHPIYSFFTDLTQVEGIFIHIKLYMVIHYRAVHLICMICHKGIRGKRVFVGIFKTFADYPIDFQGYLFGIVLLITIAPRGIGSPVSFSQNSPISAILISPIFSYVNLVS